MQSERPEYSQAVLTGEPPTLSDSRSHSQYGEDDFVSRQQRRRHIGGGRGRSNSRRASVREDDGFLSDDAAFDAESPDARLAADSDDAHDETPAIRHQNRIQEYENAMSSVKRKTSTYGFKVIPMPPGHIPLVTINNFPNEVLLHMFSHLPPTSLADISLTCRRFHDLITTPHAWRTAFSRFFIGPASLRTDVGSEEYDQLLSQRRSFARVSALASWRNEYILRSKLLRALSRGKPAEFQPPATSRGGSRTSFAQNINAVTTYRSHVLYPVTSIDASFASASGQKQALFIHGAAQEGVATTSDPLNGKFGVDSWSANTDQGLIFRRFADIYPDVAQFGMGAGSLTGVPNSIDTSQQFGYVYGEGVPAGRLFLQYTTEKRGLWLGGWGLSDDNELAPADPRAGIPDLRLVRNFHSVTSVWIAKNPNILRLSQGLIAVLAGSSTGILTAYSLGASPHYASKYSKGQITAKWALCPGVPIISIKVDEQVSESRLQNDRVWAVVTNALGEVFYLDSMPTPLSTPLVRGRNRLDMTEPNLALADRNAWLTGQTVSWHLILPSRRTIRPDAVGLHSQDIDFDPEVMPRPVCNAEGLTEPQVAARTWELQKWLALIPIRLREIYDSWDMRRRIEVDFAGGDIDGGGEGVVVICCGWNEVSAEVTRYTRIKGPQTPSEPDTLEAEAGWQTSLFGGPVRSESISNKIICSDSAVRSGDEWRVTELDFAQKGAEITASAIDCSTFATLTVDEDPMVIISGGRNSSSTSGMRSSSISTPTSPSMPATYPSTTPRAAKQPRSGKSASEIPGQRGRYLAIGTSTGAIIVWDIRTHPNHRSDHANTLLPLSVLRTESPEISSLALTSLYLVHGGNDGLVQAWDPLVSSTKPIRTLNSRFSSRARKHLRFAEEHLQIVGTNWYAAKAIVLDPDACSLVGMVALGSHLRFWAYSSAGTDGFKGTKRRTRPGTPRHAHVAGPGDGGSGQMRMRNGMREYIASEEHDMRVDAEEREKENAILSNRFGVDLLGPGASEEEVLAYARLLSEEAHEKERLREEERAKEAVNSTQSNSAAGPETKREGDDDGEWEEIPPELLQDVQNTSSAYPSSHHADVGVGNVDDEEIDADLAEALRLSLLDAERNTDASNTKRPFLDYQASSSAVDTRGNHAQNDLPSSAAQAASVSTTAPGGSSAESSNTQAPDDVDPDLAYAIQLSLAEEESRKHAQLMSQDYGEYEDWEFHSLEAHRWDAPQGAEEEEKEEFPALGSNGKDKGKGKAKGKEKGW